MNKAMNPIFKVLLCICALSVSGAGAAYAGPKEDAIAAYDIGDFKKAARLFEPLAEQGDAFAQFKLGVMYADGKGVKQNLKAAQDWYAKSADQGLADAQYNLGLLYYPENAAKNLFEKAAGQGMAEAQHMLGVMYERGMIADPVLGMAISDPAQAANWYQEAADQGFAPAQEALVSMHKTKEERNANIEFQKRLAQQKAETEKARVELEQRLAIESKKKALQESIEAARRETEKAEAIAQAEQVKLKSENKKDDEECKSFGAVVGSPAYVQCRISLKALRQGVLDNQKKAAQDDARADELKAQSEQQQRLAQQRAEQEAQQAQAREQAREQRAEQEAQQAREQRCSQGFTEWLRVYGRGGRDKLSNANDAMAEYYMRSGC